MSNILNTKRVEWAPALPWRRLQQRFLTANLHPDFWTMYAASIVVDLGLCIYFLMFNLFLVERRFGEQAIGYITAALTVGTLCGTLPISYLARRFGLRVMMLLYVSAAPACLAARTLFLQMSAQLCLAFFAGALMSIWAVCFSPALAKITTHSNRTFGFSLFIATGIGSGALAGIIGGYLPDWVHQASGRLDGLQIVLGLACAIVSLSAFAVLRLRFGIEKPAETKTHIFSAFLVRFLISIGLWNFSICFFTPFASVFLSRHLGLPINRIGVIFSVSQLTQVVTVLAAPLLYRRVGLVSGIAVTQLATASLLLGLSRASGHSGAICIYLLLTGAQWMSGAGIFSLLMERTPEQNRSYASALHNFVNLAAQASSTALAGKVFERYGYSWPLALNAGFALTAAFLVFTLLRESETVPAGRLASPESSTSGGHYAPLP